jgi:transcriptional regulator with XRE-family HTH domain
LCVEEKLLLDCTGTFPCVVCAVHPLQQQFGAVLRRRREAAGLSQEALAAQANLHRNYVGLLERGQRMPSILVVQRLAAALDTTMSELLAEVEQE